MTIRNLVAKAEQLGFMDEEVTEVTAYLNILSPQDIARGTCGACKHRKRPACPWPKKSSLAMPICLSFEQK